MTLSRRQLLAATALISGRALAFGDDARFMPAVLEHAGKWDLRNSGLRRLAWELQRRTSVETSLEVRALKADSSKIFECPFLYLCGEGELPPFSQAEVENLRRYLTYGGFLFAESCDGTTGTGFDAGLRREIARVLPQAPLHELPATHVIFKTFFLLEAAPGRLFNTPLLEGAVVSGRAAVMVSHNDVLGALARDESGGYEFQVTPGGDRQRETATRVALNVAMYALCLDYKDDAVHLPLIMKRRR